MIEKRPISNLIGHLMLIIGIIIVVFPIYYTFVASSMRLPTHRKLADDLKLSVQTVSRAYDELIRRGLISGEVGRGSFVQTRPREPEPPYLPERLGELIDLSILKPVCEQYHLEKMRLGFAWLAENLPPSSALSFRPNMGSDAEHKNEVDPHAIARATYVADSLKQTRRLGELHHAIAAHLVSAEAEFPELGQVIAGLKPGRTRADEITIADLTGTGIQDTAIATLALGRANAADAGTTFES